MIQDTRASLYPPEQHCYENTILGPADATWSLNVFSLLDVPVDAGSADAGHDGGVSDAGGSPDLPRRMRWDNNGHVTSGTNPPSNCDGQFVLEFGRD